MYIPDIMNQKLFVLQIVDNDEETISLYFSVVQYKHNKSKTFWKCSKKTQKELGLGWGEGRIK